MELDGLKEEVVSGNQGIARGGLARFTFGNVSGIARKEGLVVIKPSGVEYDALTAADMVVSDLEGNIVEGRWKPSSDLETHLVLYRAFPEIGGVVHTHSEYATAWAQAAKPIPCYGTTHADYFHGSIPVTRMLRGEEVQEAYVHKTGMVILECFRERKIDPLAVPAVLVAGHAPFCWGKSVEDAVHCALALEYIARLAAHTASLAGNCAEIPQHLLDRHHTRKHGPNATYGQAATGGCRGDEIKTK